MPRTILLPKVEVVNDRAQHLSEAREDERIRYTNARRVSTREKELLASEHRRMTERRDLVDRMDDTDFQPGALI